MAQITQVINMLAGIGSSYTGTANTYVPGYNVQTRLNIADFDGTVTVYFEADIYNAGSAGQTTYCQLYNLTDGATISGSEVTTTANSGQAIRNRSGAITLSGDKDYIVQMKHSNTTTAAEIYGARIIVVQSGTITKTQIHIDIGNEKTITSTSNTNREKVFSTFLYEATKYDGTVIIRHDAILKAPAGQTITSGIYDETAVGIITSSEVNTTTSTNHIRVSSANITLTDGNIYKPTFYVTSGTSVSESNKLVITLTSSPTKFLAMWPNQTSNGDATTSASFVYDLDHAILWDITDFSGVTVAYYYEQDMAISNAAETSTSVLRDITTPADYSGSTLTNTGSTTNNRVRTSVLSVPGSAIEIGAGIKATNGATANLYNGYLVLEVSGMGGTTTSTSSTTTSSSTTTTRSTSSSTSTSSTTTSSSTSTTKSTSTSISTSTSSTTTSSSTTITKSTSTSTSTTKSTSTSSTTTSSSTSTTKSTSTSLTTTQSITTSTSSTTTSSSTSTTKSTSTSTSKSTSTSTTTTLNPISGGLAFGEQNPTMGETASSWQLWSDGGGIVPTIIGDSDWGKLQLSLNAQGRSGVYDFGSSSSRSVTLTENRYGTGQGTATLQIRGHNTTTFIQDDTTPTWENYIGTVNKTWKYIQVRVIKEN